MDPGLLALAFERPAIDWHAVAPEIVLLSMGCLITLLDIVFLDRIRPYTGALAGLGLLATTIPILTLAVDGTDRKSVPFARALDFRDVLETPTFDASQAATRLDVALLDQDEVHAGQFISVAGGGSVTDRCVLARAAVAGRGVCGGV